VDELIAFLHARLEETERDPAAGVVLKRFIKAARAIIATAEKQPGWHLYGPDDKRDLDDRRCDEAVQIMLAEILHHMAAVWEGHPGFRDEWRMMPENDPREYLASQGMIYAPGGIVVSRFEVPDGHCLVHNQVYPDGRRPALRQGWQGSRFWAQRPGTGPALEPCGCGWAPEHGTHYRPG
jgi:hypothetical protein